jgi:hypothetical protein
MKKITEQRYLEQKRYKHKKELRRFDLILKEIFSKAVGIIFWLATGQKIEGKAKILSTEIRFVKSFYPDILLEITPDVFIKSDKPEEVLVGILAGKFKDKPEIIKKVKKRIVEIVKDEKEIAKYIDNISFLAGLFDIEIKVKPMPIQVDIRKTFLYKWGREEGIKEGEQRGLVKGLRKGLKEGILGIVQAKFGAQKAKLIKSFLEKVDDISHLKKIKRELIRAETWDDFIKALKSSNSKNKNSKPKLT